jgi:hypothetical protein
MLPFNPKHEALVAIILPLSIGKYRSFTLVCTIESSLHCTSRYACPSIHT